MQLADTLSQFAEEETALNKELHSLQSNQRELQHLCDKQGIALSNKDREAVRLKEEKVSAIRQTLPPH